jgi:protocatechuate 3,4-dioxygenase beta subunit
MASPPDTQARDEHDLGLTHDLGTLRTMLGRRSALRLLGGAGIAAVLAACGSSSDSSSGATTTTGDAGTPSTTGVTTSTTGAAASGVTVSAREEIPGETSGPYPGDGSNGPDALGADGVVRQDIRSSFGTSSTTAEGVDLRIDLVVVEAATGEALSGAAVYLWHCDAEGRYSMYSRGVTGENYLRGVQEAGADGSLAFQSIFPAAYSGRWPHIHFEVYASVDDATSGGSPIKTSQLALPEDACDLVYATSGYEQSVRNMDQTSLTSDMVFSDGVEEQLATVTGDVNDGFVASLVVRV